MTTVLWLYVYVYIVNNVKYDNLFTCFDYPIRSDQLIETVNRESILFFKPIPNTTGLWWMPLDLTDDKSTLIQVMAWCRQATSHYLNQCWPRSLSQNGVTRPLESINAGESLIEHLATQFNEFEWKYSTVVFVFFIK